MPRDVERIQEMLTEIEVLLTEICADDGDYLLQAFTNDPEYQHQVREMVDEARARLERAREEVSYLSVEDRINNNEHAEGLMRRLWLAGLTGASLRWKHTVFTKLVAKYRVSGTSLWFKRVMDFVNTFLGSLSLALPELEAVKEAFGLFGAIAKISRKKKSANVGDQQSE